MKNYRYYIYGLFDPRNGELRYIGQTVKILKYRLKNHLYDAVVVKKDNYNYRWIRDVCTTGFVPEIQLIQELYSKENLDQAEIYWIKYFREQGCRLTNITDGGEGTLGRVKPELERKIHSDRWKKYHQEHNTKGANHPMYGKKQSATARQQMSDSKKKLYAAGLIKPWNKGKEINSYKQRLEISKKQGGKPFKDQFGNVYNLQQEAAEAIGCGRQSIGRVLSGERKSIKGYIFKYLES